MFINSNPEEVVQNQLEAYNARNIEAFMSLMSKDVALYEFGNSSPSVAGFDEVKKIYNNLFEQSPNLHSTILSRMVLGNKVIDHESIKGRMGNTEIIELIVIYEVNANLKINKITVLRE